jgi:UPF0755 protein
MRSTWMIKQPFGLTFKFLITLFIVVVIPLILITTWVSWALSPVNEEAKEKIFVIKKGESTTTFSERLEEEKLIKSAVMFRIYLKLTGLDKKIQAGSFRLSSAESAKEIALSLTEGRLDKWVTIIEGLRREEVADIIAEDFDIDTDEFLKEAVEGELFPDTYLISTTATEEQILTILRTNFNKKFGEDLEKQAAKNKLNKKEVVILASIVERETQVEEQRAVIAGILLKRWRQGMSIAADATTQYALGYSEEEKTWWRKNLTEEDLKINSPYNTRARTGLPPGPICSPSLASIEAVAKPATSDYYFYLHDEDGNVHYAKTYAEHQQNIAKYLSQ